MGLLELLAAALAVVVAGYLAGRRQGVAASKQRAKEADHARAERIEDAADRARRADGADPLERLRGAGRIRD